MNSQPPKAQADKLKAFVEDLLECLDVPERNCSCHIAPPCHDCVENGGLREAITNVKDALAALDAQPVAQEPDFWVMTAPNGHKWMEPSNSEVGRFLSMNAGHTAKECFLGAAPTSKPEREVDEVCQEADGCPTEKAVLQRFWRAQQQSQPIGSKPEVVAKIDKAIRTVSALCNGSKRWTMCVPADRENDPDLIIADALGSAKEALCRTEASSDATVWPKGFTVKRVDGHGWIVDTPTGSRWVAHEDTSIADFMAALAAPSAAPSQPARDDVLTQLTQELKNTPLIYATKRIELSMKIAAILELKGAPISGEKP